MQSTMMLIKIPQVALGIADDHKAYTLCLDMDDSSVFQDYSGSLFMWFLFNCSIFYY